MKYIAPMYNNQEIELKDVITSSFGQTVNAEEDKQEYDAPAEGIYGM